MAKVHIPTPLRGYTRGQQSVTVAGTTVSQIIENLESEFPGIRERICDDAGTVRRFVNVFVADEDIRFMDNLATTVGEDDEISIIPAIAGG